MKHDLPPPPPPPTTRVSDPLPNSFDPSAFLGDLPHPSSLVAPDLDGNDRCYFPLSTAQSDSLISRILDLASTNWHEPDLEGLLICMAFVGAYHLHETNPFWLNVVGPPGTGKTSLGLAVVENLSTYCHAMDDITPAALLSGYTKGKGKGKNNSLLHRIGEAGILYSLDLTNLLSKDPKSVESIAGTMRQVYDGRSTKNVGAGGHTVSWAGRVSWIAALTPGYEAAWTRFNPGGNRSLTLRWRDNGDPLRVSEAVTRAQDEEARQTYKKGALETLENDTPRGQIRQLMEVIVGEIEVGLVPKPLTADPTTGQQKLLEMGIYHLAQVIAIARTHPNRPDGKNISTATDFENPGRIQHQLLKIARGLAFLRRLPCPTDAEIALIYRVAFDSIPYARAVVMAPFALDGSSITVRDLLEQTGYRSLEPLKWQLNDLAALNIATCVSADEDEGGTFHHDTPWKFTDTFLALVHTAFPSHTTLTNVKLFGDLSNNCAQRRSKRWTKISPTISVKIPAEVGNKITQSLLTT